MAPRRSRSKSRSSSSERSREHAAGKRKPRERRPRRSRSRSRSGSGGGREKQAGEGRTRQEEAHENGGASGRYPKRCFECNSEGHLAKDCPSKAEGAEPSKQGANEGGPKCYRCLEEGHLARDCQKPEEELPPEPKPEFGLSGKLEEEANQRNGIALKYSEPTDAAEPGTGWRLYVFKGDAPADADKPYVELRKSSFFLFGKERRAADIPTDHPSCSRQHAVVQFRHGDGKPRPYLIDLESTNGTTLNGQAIDPSRYHELFEQDVIRFGNSSRDYVLLHESSASS